MKNAKELTLYYDIRTSFNGYDKHPVLEGISPVPLLEKDLTCAEKSYASLRTEHLVEYETYYDRVRLSLGEEEEDRDLRQRLIDFKDHPEDIGLSALLFQYGRYLLIASSRPGTQAANLRNLECGAGSALVLRLHDQYQHRDELLARRPLQPGGDGRASGEAL